jgi:sugar O-acyltransferase (sialic acid O-acetyltransferase NeuD family)
MRDIYIIGAGGHGKVVLDIIDKSSEFNAYAFLDDDQDLLDKEINGVKVIGNLDLVFEDNKAAVIAVGNNKIRKKISKDLIDNDVELINAVHPSAVLNSYLEIGKGNVVAAGAVVNSSTIIEDNVIINTGATVDHDCKIESHVHISPGVNLGGNVKVREGAHIGIGASVIPGIEIGRNAVVGAGAVVIEDVPDDVTVVGVPARIIK